MKKYWKIEEQHNSRVLCSRRIVSSILFFFSPVAIIFLIHCSKEHYYNVSRLKQCILISQKKQEKLIPFLIMKHFKLLLCFFFLFHLNLIKKLIKIIQYGVMSSLISLSSHSLSMYLLKGSTYSIVIHP